MISVHIDQILPHPSLPRNHAVDEPSPILKHGKATYDELP